MSTNVNGKRIFTDFQELKFRQHVCVQFKQSYVTYYRHVVNFLCLVFFINENIRLKSPYCLWVSSHFKVSNTWSIFLNTMALKTTKTSQLLTANFSKDSQLLPNVKPTWLWNATQTKMWSVYSKSRTGKLCLSK